MSSGSSGEMNGPTQAGGVARTRFGELASEALRYWEPRRLAYNNEILIRIS